MYEVRIDLMHRFEVQCEKDIRTLQIVKGIASSHIQDDFVL